MQPGSVEAARTLLIELGAPPRLLRHVELVGEAGELLVEKAVDLDPSIRADLIRVGIVIHDAGKILHPRELDQSGGEHEPAGEALLLGRGVTPELARICVSHARWVTMPASIEELFVALADKLWKGVRNRELEERVIDELASRLQVDRWSIFTDLDGLFEDIAADGAARLERSRV